MDWETLIDALLDNVKDADARQDIYSKLLENCDYSEADLIEEVMGVDAAFDVAAQEFLDDKDNDDEDEEFEEDEDYETVELDFDEE
jgi:hypothetical protein